MKKRQWMCVLIVAGLTALMPVSQGMAFRAIDLGGDAKLTVYGFLRNNLGIFTDRIDYAQDGDDLATCRTWLRTYFDLQISRNLRMWTAIQFVHEPSYEMETGSQSTNAGATNMLNGNLGYGGIPTLEDGKEYSEYYKYEDVLREIYLDWRISRRHSLRIGRQIVIWGESLTTSVGDFVHPQDTRFTFAFANWEDTRIPQWMIKGNHQFPEINLGLEWLLMLNLLDENYRVNRGGAYDSSAGLANVGMFGIRSFPGQRFGIHPEDRLIVPHPVIRAFNSSGIPVFGIPDVGLEYPANSLRDSHFGLRTSSFIGLTEFGIMYFHGPSYNPVLKYGRHTGGFPGFREFTLKFPTQDIFGAYYNTDLPIGLSRGELIYIPNRAFGNLRDPDGLADQGDVNAITDRAYIKYMICYDLSGYIYPNWKKDSAIDVSIEHVGEYIPSRGDTNYAVYNTHNNTWTPSFNGRIATTWGYSKWATEIIAGWSPRDDSGLFMPFVKYTPQWWNNAWSFELRYIRIFGDNSYEGLGLLEQKDLLVFTTQLNF